MDSFFLLIDFYCLGSVAFKNKMKTFLYSTAQESQRPSRVYNLLLGDENGVLASAAHRHHLHPLQLLPFHLGGFIDILLWLTFKINIYYISYQGDVNI